MRRTLAALMAAGLLVAAGCGGDDDDEGASGGDGGGSSTEEFCDAYNSYFNDLTSAETPEDAAETLANIDPPAEIADEWEALSAGIQSGDPTDPALTEAATSIGTFVAQECDLSATDLPSESVPEP